MPEQSAVARFEEWAIVEVMGHASYAGLGTDCALGGAAFIRVDVPEVGERPGFVKLLAPGSIFSITPCTRESAVEWTRDRRTRPFPSIDLVQARVPALPGFRGAAYDDEDEGDH